MLALVACTAHQPSQAAGSDNTRLAFDAFFSSPQFNEWFTDLANQAGRPGFVVEAAPVMLPTDAPPPREWVPPLLWSGLWAPESASDHTARIASAEAMGWRTLTVAEEQRLFHTTPPSFDRYATWQPGWSDFYREHPDAVGILGVSSLATSPDGKQALLYAQVLTDHSHGQCGHGGVALLARADGGWQVEQYATTWVGY